MRIIKQQLPSFVAFVGPNFRVRDLRPQDVEKWLAQRTDRQHDSPLHVNHPGLPELAAKPVTLGGGELTVENPIRGRLKMPEGESRGAEAVWAPATFEQVLKVSNPAFANVVRILAWTGAPPPGLVCNLEAKHFNTQHRDMDVEDFYKGRNSKKKYLKHLRLNQLAVDLVGEQVKKHPEGVLFPNAHGNPTAASLQIYLSQLRTKFKETVLAVLSKASEGA